MASTEGLPLPPDVYWNGESFLNSDNKSMGGKFFDAWKERRDEFPKSARELVGLAEEPPEEQSQPKSTVPRRRANSSKLPAEVVEVPDDMLVLARQRKALYDAYLTVGFTQQEALELCVK